MSENMIINFAFLEKKYNVHYIFFFKIVFDEYFHTMRKIREFTYRFSFLKGEKKQVTLFCLRFIY